MLTFLGTKISNLRKRDSNNLTPELELSVWTQNTLNTSTGNTGIGRQVKQAMPGGNNQPDPDCEPTQKKRGAGGNRVL